MREDKLRQVIGVLKEVPPESFEMNYWWTQSDCGTVGCAIGWVIQELGPDFGLYLNRNRFGTLCVENRLGDQNYEAISEVLDIDPNEAMWLFSPFGYEELDEPIAASRVIARIEQFLQGERPKRDYTYVV